MQGEWEQSSIYLQLFKTYISLKTCRRLEELKCDKERHKNNMNNEKITGFHNSFSLISSLAPGYFPFLIKFFSLYLPKRCTQPHQCFLASSPIPAPNMKFHSFPITASFLLLPVYSSSSQLFWEKSLQCFILIFLPQSENKQ